MYVFCDIMVKFPLSRLVLGEMVKKDFRGSSEERSSEGELIMKNLSNMDRKENLVLSSWEDSENAGLRP
jgi:hypothetical protein